MPQSSVNPLDHIAIQNVLSRYCDALDTKDWALLNDVFVADVDADYPFNRNLKGAEAVSKAIQGRYVLLPFSHPQPILEAQNHSYGLARSCTFVTST